MTSIIFTLDSELRSVLLSARDGATVFGQSRRNSTYGEANYCFDQRVARDIKLSERLGVEVLGEAFNLFNRSNFTASREVFSQKLSLTNSGEWFDFRPVHHQQARCSNLRQLGLECSPLSLMHFN